MSLIVFRVGVSLGRWAVLHNDRPLATFDTEEEAAKAALALATHHAPQDTAEVDLPAGGGVTSEIRVF